MKTKRNVNQHKYHKGEVKELTRVDRLISNLNKFNCSGTHFYENRYLNNHYLVEDVNRFLKYLESKNIRYEVKIKNDKEYGFFVDILTENERNTFKIN